MDTEDEKLSPVDIGILRLANDTFEQAKERMREQIQEQLAVQLRVPVADVKRAWWDAGCS